VGKALRIFTGMSDKGWRALPSGARGESEGE
jgi:hypothetical protein